MIQHQCKHHATILGQFKLPGLIQVGLQNFILSAREMSVAFLVSVAMKVLPLEPLCFLRGCLVPLTFQASGGSAICLISTSCCSEFNCPKSFSGSRSIDLASVSCFSNLRTVARFPQSLACHLSSLQMQYLTTRERCHELFLMVKLLPLDVIIALGPPQQIQIQHCRMDV